MEDGSGVVKSVVPVYPDILHNLWWHYVVGQKEKGSKSPKYFFS